MRTAKGVSGALGGGGSRRGLCATASILRPQQCAAVRTHALAAPLDLSAVLLGALRLKKSPYSARLKASSSGPGSSAKKRCGHWLLSICLCGGLWLSGWGFGARRQRQEAVRPPPPPLSVAPLSHCLGQVMCWLGVGLCLQLWSVLVVSLCKPDQPSN